MRMQVGKVLLLALFFSCILSLSAPVLAQCPMCKANVESTLKGPGRKTGLGLNKGIIMLLAMPYTAFMVVGVLWYMNSRDKKRKRLISEQ